MQTEKNMYIVFQMTAPDNNVLFSGRLFMEGWREELLSILISYC